jgi:prepilin-type N-terminal cleavage/methylation domain-containing protein
MPLRTTPLTGRARARRAFTLVEVAVTIVILGIGLTMVLQALNTAKLRAAQTRNYKLARDLALYTLGELESGLYRDDLRDRFSGSYAERGQPDFTFEVVLGDEQLRDRPDTRKQGFHDRFAQRQYDLEQDTARDSSKEEKTAKPFEKVKIRVVFPALSESSNELTLERWMPWEQVYGPVEDEAAGGEGGSKP